MKKYWSGFKSLLGRLFRRPPAPGRFEEGSKFSWRGWLSIAPLVWPSRDYLVYVPRGWMLFRRAPLLVLCHGCKQDAEIIAEGTRIAELADREGWLVLLPRQKDDANAWRCWNWFDVRTAGGSGEAAILAAQIDSVRRHYRADKRRIVVAGISAGGSMAAILGLRYPQLVRAVFAHSAIACGAATSAVTALAVIARGPETDVLAIAEGARRLAGNTWAPVPLCVVQGEGDNVVAPRNATALVRQYLRFHHHPAGADASGSVVAPADNEHHDTLSDGRVVVTREWRNEGKLIVRYVSIPSLAHAWSGGDPKHPFNDPRPPDATEMLRLFARDAVG